MLVKAGFKVTNIFKQGDANRIVEASVRESRDVRKTVHPRSRGKFVTVFSAVS